MKNSRTVAYTFIMENRSEHFETGTGEAVNANIRTYMGENPDIDINKSVDTKKRIDALIQKSEDGCWTWAGGMNGNLPAYSSYKFGKINVRRYLIESSREDALPKSVLLRTACGNNRCVNPEHIGYNLAGEHPGVNIGTERAFSFKDDRCVKGHDLTLPRAIVTSSRSDRGGAPRRDCRECLNIRKRANKAAKRAAQASTSPEETLENESGQ